MSAAAAGLGNSSGGGTNTFQLPLGGGKSVRKPPSRKSKLNNGSACSSNAGSSNSVLQHIDSIVKEGGDPIPDFNDDKLEGSTSGI